MAEARGRVLEVLQCMYHFASQMERSPTGVCVLFIHRLFVYTGNIHYRRGGADYWTRFSISMTYVLVWLLFVACAPGRPGMGTDGILFSFIDPNGYDLDGPGRGDLRLH